MIHVWAHCLCLCALECYVLSLVTAPVMMTMVTMMKGDGDVVVDDHDDDGLRGLLLASVSKNDIVA